VSVYVYVYVYKHACTGERESRLRGMQRAGNIKFAFVEFL